MKPVCLEVGLMRCNNYLLINDATDEALLIDCGGTGEDAVLAAQQYGVRIAAVLLTHGHADHIEGAARVAKQFSCPIYLHRFDSEYPERPECNLSMRIYMRPLTYDIKPVMVEDGDRIDAAGFDVEVIHTPGHTLGSVCYRVGDILFTGDTLFRDSIGGDFPPFGNLETEIESIRNRLFGLNKEMVCYPGHGEPTTLFYEMKNNMYCRI